MPSRSSRSVIELASTHRLGSPGHFVVPIAALRRVPLAARLAWWPSLVHSSSMWGLRSRPASQFSGSGAGTDFVPRWRSSPTSHSNLRLQIGADS
jgi:hypothetical protein